MPAWLRRLTQRAPRDAGSTLAEPAPTFRADLPPTFDTRLDVDSPGAPGRAGAEAMYSKWAARWQEF